MGVINFYGPKHSGSLAVILAVPTVLAVIALILISAPHLTTHYLEPLHESYAQVWVQFCSVILALSGVEAIANLTGVMKLDKGATIAEPRVGARSMQGQSGRSRSRSSLRPRCSVGQCFRNPNSMS